MSTFLGNEELKLLKDGKWESYSGDMIAEKYDGSETISGPGFVRQINHNYFQITIFNLSVKGGDKENLLHQLPNYKYKPGEIIPQSENYKLLTPDGWKSNWLTEPEKYYSSSGTITTFYTREIFSERKRDQQNAKASVSFRAFHEYKNYPSNNIVRYGKYIEGEGQPGASLCVADIDVWNYSLRYMVHEGESLLRLTSRRNKKKHNDFVEFRAIEALEFVLGEPFEWNLKTVSDSTIVRQHIMLIPNRLSVRNRRPYEDYWVPKSKAAVMFWDLYSKMLRYTLKDKTSNFTELGIMLNNLACLRSSEHELSAYILNLCVVIEDLLLHHFCKTITDSKRSKLIRDLLKNVDSFLGSRKTDKKLSNTIKSHISRLSQTKENPKRILLRLAREKHILKQRIDSWEELRNKVVHGRRIVPSQVVFNKTGDCETLLFQIIFQMINYRGRYTDYGMIYYPKKLYPKEL